VSTSSAPRRSKKYRSHSVDANLLVAHPFLAKCEKLIMHAIRLPFQRIKGQHGVFLEVHLQG